MVVKDCDYCNMKNFLNIKPVYFNKPSSIEAFKYLEKQNYLKFSKIKKNKKILLIGFGGGLSWGISLINN